MNLDQLTVFVEVASRRSFTRAAESLGLSQSTVTRHVQALEAETEVSLVERSGRTIRLTEAGEALLRFAETVLEEHRHLEDQLRRLRSTVQVRQLRIAASDTPGEFIVPDLLAAFRREVPGFAPRLEVVPSLEVVHRLRARRIDLGFVGAAVTGPGLTSVPILQDRLVVALPARHPLASGPEIGIGDLGAEQLILPGEESGTMRSLRRLLGEAGASLPGEETATHLGSGRSVIEAVRAGHGLGIVSTLALRGIPPDEIVGRPIRGIDLTRDLCLLYDARDLSNPLRDQFLLFVQRSITTAEARAS